MTQQLVEEDDVRAEEAGSPERALLAWWRNAQFMNLTGYLEGLSEAVAAERRDDGSARQGLPILAGQLRTAKPVIRYVEVLGDTATVYADIRYRQAVGANRFTTTSAPQAFAMVRERREWRLADDLFAESLIRPALEEQARERARQDAAAQAGDSP